jgi:hypothetical protein
MIQAKPTDAKLVKNHTYSTLPFGSGFLPHSNKPAARHFPGLGESNPKPYTLFILLLFLK